MPAVQPHSLNAAASNAAGSGDFPAAAAILRRLLEVQTSRLGPDHPDLATTLNNLALMLERSGDTAEAGRCYRRALAVATLAHGPDAASVRVSQANLAAFYREFGADGHDGPPLSPGGLDDFAPLSAHVSAPPPETPRAITTDAPSAVVITRPAAPPTAALPAPPLESPPPARPAATRPWRNPQAIAAIGKTPEVRLPIFAARRPSAPPPAPPVRPMFIPQDAPASSWRRAAGGMLILVLGIAVAGVPAWWLRRGSPAAPPPVAGVVAPGIGTSGDAAGAATSATEEATPLLAGKTSVSEAGPVAAPTAEPVLPLASANAEDGASPAPASDDGALPGPDSPALPTTLRVAEAGLCAELSIGQGPWRCEPTRETSRGGSVYYYTRVASPRDELVRHRWTRDGRLVQMVVLRILTNPGDGYRTFSRQSGPLLEAGTWRVALLAPDGRVLDETEFTVD